MSTSKNMDPEEHPNTSEINGWKFESKVDHILNSKCVSPFICQKARTKYCPDKKANLQDTPLKSEEKVQELKALIWPATDLCNFCKFDLILEMSHLPDMTYPENILTVRHKTGFTIVFNVLDALSPVIIKSIGLPQGMKVSSSEVWLKSRMNCEYTSKVHNAAFDWTFTTDYPGTIDPQYTKLFVPTDERINFQKLMQRDKIHWFKEIDLFEDELADHGTAHSIVKMRVMPDCFFILLRYFLRVDNVFVRFYDTRYYHEFSKEYLIRERTISESTIAGLKLSDEQLYLLVSPHELYSHVPQTSLIVEKLDLSLLNNPVTSENQ